MAESPHFVAHDNPIWRDRATTVVRAAIPNPPDGGEWFEQMWSRRVDDGRYELCCIPFATYDYALGDVVEVGPGGDSKFLVRRIVERSGRRVLRVWLADAPQETWDELQGMLRFRRLLFEYQKPALVAIDVADDASCADLEAELRKYEQGGRLRYERASEGYVPPGFA